MAHNIKVGTMIYHASRYWCERDNPTTGESLGWNARYLPYIITRITDKTIFATGCGPDGKPNNVRLPRRMEKYPKAHSLVNTGKQYHSRFHEYFYVEIPKTRSLPPTLMSNYAHALLLLGIAPPFTDKDVTRAYKRLALNAHPDRGGKDEDFIKLKNARDVVLRGY